MFMWAVVLASAASQPIEAGDQIFGGPIDAAWRAWLDAPPERARNLTAALAARADQVAASISEAGSDALGDVDLVCSGGGDLNAYYLGIEMVLSRVAAATSTLRQHRRGGASGGGWIIFELALKGEARTLESYLSYGMLQEANPIHFSTIATAVLLQDHHWRMMSKWQANKWNSSLPLLDNRVNLALACGWTDTKLKMVTQYTSPGQAASAFVATGAIQQIYEGDLCADGSGVSGPNMTPLFQDAARAQLIVNLMETGFPTLNMGGGKFTSNQYFELVQRGQDEAAEFIRTGRVARNAKAITLCPAHSRVSGNTCGGR